MGKSYQYNWDHNYPWGAQLAVASQVFKEKEEHYMRDANKEHSKHQERYVMLRSDAAENLTKNGH